MMSITLRNYTPSTLLARACLPCMPMTVAMVLPH
jgi:hypothetical protein